MEALESLPPIVALVLGLVLLAWLVLVFLVPFMIEGIRQSTRKTQEELAELNDRIERLTDALEQNQARMERSRAGATAPPEARTPRAPDDARRRREPTISETGFESERPRERREPIIR